MKKPVAAPSADVAMKDAKFAYFSKCCNEVAKKTPLVMPKGRRVGYFGSAPSTDDQGTLGKFRCAKCGKPCKVSRLTRKQEKANG